MDQTAPLSRGCRLVRLLFVGVFVVLLVAAIAYVVWQILQGAAGTGLTKALQDSLSANLPPKEKLVGEVIQRNYSDYRDNAVRWSATYHCCLFFSAALSALAGLVLKLEFFLKNAELKRDLAALLAMSSALLITVSTVGEFQQHWRANRLAAAQTESLGYEFITKTKNRDPEYFSSKIQDIAIRRTQDIVGYHSTDRGRSAKSKE